jgi:hypothetical protein
VKLLGQLDAMPEQRKRGRKGQVGKIVEETLKPNPGKVFHFGPANASTVTVFRKTYGVDAISFTTDTQALDENGKPKVDEDGNKVYEVHIAARWPGDKEAAEIRASYRKDGNKAKAPAAAAK